MLAMILMMLFLLINVARAWVCKDGDSKCGSVSATINNVKQCCPDGCGISSSFYNGGLINVCTGCGSDNGCTPAGGGGSSEKRNGGVSCSAGIQCKSDVCYGNGSCKGSLRLGDDCSKSAECSVGTASIGSRTHSCGQGGGRGNGRPLAGNILLSL